MPADTVLLTSGDVGGVAVGVEEFDVAGGEAVPAQHRIDSTGVVGVPAAPRPGVPPARQQHRPVADLQSTRRQSTIVRSLFYTRLHPSATDLSLVMLVKQ